MKLKDKLRKKKISQNENNLNINNPNTLVDGIKKLSTEHSHDIDLLSSQNTSLNMIGSKQTINSTYNYLSSLEKEEKWRVGIVCKKDCYFIVLEILKCLERMGYVWKLVSSSYKIKCKKKDEDEEGKNQGKSLNILIQIFGVRNLLFSDP